MPLGSGDLPRKERKKLYYESSRRCQGFLLAMGLSSITSSLLFSQPGMTVPYRFIFFAFRAGESAWSLL